MKTFITMKTLPVLASVAALVALVLASASFELVTSVLFAAGFVAIALTDYSSGARLRAAAPAGSAVPAGRSGRTERFGLAA